MTLLYAPLWFWAFRFSFQSWTNSYLVLEVFSSSCWVSLCCMIFLDVSRCFYVWKRLALRQGLRPRPWYRLGELWDLDISRTILAYHLTTSYIILRHLTSCWIISYYIPTIVWRPSFSLVVSSISHLPAVSPLRLPVPADHSTEYAGASRISSN